LAGQLGDAEMTGGLLAELMDHLQEANTEQTE
jgi:hypothetical protein